MSKVWGEADRCVKFYQKKLERKENEMKKKNTCQTCRQV